MDLEAILVVVGEVHFKMSVPLSSRVPWELANPQWASQLNPIIASPLSSVSILENINLINGATTINHGLGRTLKGWFLTDINGVATVYRSQPFNDKTLTLTSNAIVTTSIGVF